MLHKNESFEEYKKRLSERGKEGVRAEIVNDVYKVCLIFETLEGMGKVRGNGHHMAQNVAQYAADLLEERWRE